MYYLGSANRGQIAVSLIGKHHVFRPRPLNAGSNRRRASMRRFMHIAVKIIIGEYCAANGRNPYGLLAHAQFLQGFGNQTVDNTVSAPRTVMKGHVRKH